MYAPLVNLTSVSLPDDEDDYSIGYEAVIQFFEPEENSEKYYKIRVSDPSIFGKIETL